MVFLIFICKSFRRCPLSHYKSILGQDVPFGRLTYFVVLWNCDVTGFITIDHHRRRAVREIAMLWYRQAPANCASQSE